MRAQELVSPVVAIDPDIAEQSIGHSPKPFHTLERAKLRRRVNLLHRRKREQS